MPEYKPPTTEAEFNENFSQIKPLMSANEAFYESARCLFCYDAPCITACPTGIDIPLFIRQINSKNDIGAAKTIYQSNYFGYACGKVCPTEVLCEGACVYNHADVKPIEIGRLQSYATDKAMSVNTPLYKNLSTSEKKVAVIGAGPAGISCACELRQYGYQVDVFDGQLLPSGLTVHGVAPYKIMNDEVLREVEYLRNQYGFALYCNHPISTTQDIELLERNYDAIFLGIGLGGTVSLDIPGEEKANVIGAVEFIKELRMKHQQISVPDRVIVLGGGNTAMDAASESARMGASSVVLAYRRSQEEMGAYAFEYELAKSVGVVGMFNVSPVSVLGNGSVSGVRFVRTQTVNGKVDPISNSEFDLPCDLVIKATGQSKHELFLSQIRDLQLAKNGNILVSETYQTGNPKYFAAGDAVSGGQEVVNAVAEGKMAAKGIKRFLEG